ncbi:MAG: hypothetical protein R2714_17510 [Microthrixaceae bacterium]
MQVDKSGDSMGDFKDETESAGDAAAYSLTFTDVIDAARDYDDSACGI